MGCFGKYLQFRKASLSRKAVINTFVGLAYKLWKWKFFFPFKCFFSCTGDGFLLDSKWSDNQDYCKVCRLYQRGISDPLKHLWWSILQKYIHVMFSWFVTICTLLLTLLFTLSLTLRDFLMSALCAISFPNMRKKYCISHCTQRSTRSTHSLVLPP